MTTPEQSRGERSRDEVLAGEYVLGVLDAGQRRNVEERLQRDRRFASIVSRWEENLSHYNDEYDDQMPPPMLFRSIEERLFAGEKSSEQAATSLWTSLVFWRGLSFTTLFVLATVGAIEVMQSWRPEPAPLVADMRGTASDTVSLAAHYDMASGRLKVTPVAIGAEEPKSLELWLVAGEGPPKSLGVLPETGEGGILIPAELRQQLTPGVTLAVSLEPLGGSPTGQATGPVIAAGATSY